MGFRVGINCFDTRLQADDYLLSALPPTITAEGKIIRAERQKNGWTLEGQTVKLSYPECSAVEQVKDGASVGAAFLLLLASIYAFRLLVGFVKDFGRIQGES